MLVGGADVSGNEKGRNLKYFALVVGTKPKINEVWGEIGLPYIHMRRLKSKKRNRAIKRTNFEKKDIIALCLQVNRQEIVSYFIGHKKLKNKNTNKEKIQIVFDNILLSLFRNRIEVFCQKHGMPNCIGLKVEQDSDVADSLTRWKMIPVKEGKAHQLADIVAWCNAHNKKLQGCDEKDLVNTLQKKMSKHLLK